MRPIETLLLLADLLTFSILATPRLRSVRWTGYAALIALLIAVAQVLVEGPRWQMVPAYALTVLFLLVWLLYTIAPAASHDGQKRTNRRVVGLVIGQRCSRSCAQRMPWASQGPILSSASGQ